MSPSSGRAPGAWRHAGLGRLRSRAVALVALASLPLLVLVALSRWEHRTHLQDAFAPGALGVVTDVGLEVERMVEATRLVLAALAGVPEVRDQAPGECSGFLKGLLEGFPQYTNLGAVTGEGVVYCSAEPGTLDDPTELSGRGSETAVRSVLAGRPFAVGGILVGRTSGRPILPLAVPFDGGAGALYATMDLTWVTSSSLLRSGLPEGAVMTLSTLEGEELIRSPRGASVEHLLSAELLETWRETRAPGTFRFPGADGVERLVAYRSLPGGGGDPPGMLAVTVPVREAFAPLRDALNRYVWVGVLLILVACALAWWGADALIRRPVERLVSLAQRLSEGDLSARSEPGPATGELADLGAALDEMASALQRRDHFLRATQEALRTSEQRFRAIQETSPDAFLLTHAERGQDGRIEDFRVVYANPAAERMAGDRSLVGQSLRELNPGVVAEGRLRRFVEVGETGVPLIMETPMSLLDGGSRWMRVSAVRVGGGVGIAYSDIGERKLLEEQLFQAQKLEAVGRLAGGVAHDFNNLLTVIAGTTDLLLMDVRPDSEIRSGLEDVRGAAARATALTSQLLAYSRRQFTQPRVVSLNEVVAETEGMLRRLLGPRVELRTELASGLGAVRVDPGHLGQVIVNLAVNARDAMPEGGSLTLSTEEVEPDEAFLRTHADAEPGPYVVLSVQDTGAGIPREIRGRIFEPFFTTKPRGSGTGLGLSTVYGIVRQSGGHVTVTSEVGRGSVFRVYLPRMAGQPDEPSAAAREEPPPLGSETILLAEDDPHVRSLVEGILRRFGYRTLSAGSAEEALILARSHPGRIDLLLTDVVMEGLNGRELADLLLMERPETQILYMSGYTEDTVVLRDVAGAGAHFLRKPFTPSRVAGKVRAVLDGVPEERTHGAGAVEL